MSKREFDFSKIDRGRIIAPAGCGKTHLVAEIIETHTDTKPILVLTHTNAGVAALRERLGKMGVSSSCYRLATLDGWALRLATTFPYRSEYSIDVPGEVNYPEIRSSAIRLLEGQHIFEILSASYSRILVDEYQDCSRSQHNIICQVAQFLPTCILGDPLQAIFGFDKNDPLADWERDVCEFFPLVHQLDTPWRWVNSGSKELGEWLLDVRSQLLADNPIDLRQSPKNVVWIPLEGTQNDFIKRARAARELGRNDDGQTLIVGSSHRPNSNRKIASQAPGVVVVESVDLNDMVEFARGINLESENILEQILGFTECVMTGVGKATLLKRLKTISAGRAKKPPTDIESAALIFLENRSFATIISLLKTLNNSRITRLYRPEIFYGLLQALNRCNKASEQSLYSSAVIIREQNRALGRYPRRRSIGSTLLLKGLEAENVIILNADELDKFNLYVALTRGSKSIFVCSRRPILTPKKAK